MKKIQLLLTLTCVVLLICSCNKETQLTILQTDSATEPGMIAENGNNPDEVIFSANKALRSKSYVYTESNSKEGNQIFIYDKSEDGSLHFRKIVNSGGYGTGASLSSQGAIAISDDHKVLLAVNAGSNSFSAFSIHDDGDLTLVVSVSSLGITPVSITTHGRFAYILNNASSTVCGFYYAPNGVLTKANNSPYKLSSKNADAAQVKFSAAGDELYVTEKGTTNVDAFRLDVNGNIISAVFNKSKGVEPFGFSLGRNNSIIVSNAANGLPGKGSCTAYSDDGSGNLVSSGKVANSQTASCWVATSKFGAFAYTTNTRSNNISTYYIDPNSKLMLLNSIAAVAGEAPTDIIVSADDYFVYNINSVSHTISEYARTEGGGIKKIGEVGNLPEFASGLVTY